MPCQFGSFLLDRRLGIVRHEGGDELKLRRKTFRLLDALVAAAPAVVERHTLIDRVWGEDHVSAGSLPQAISELRAALGDDAGAPSYIATVHGRGYRFVAEVVPVAPASSPVTAVVVEDSTPAPITAPVTSPSVAEASVTTPPMRHRIRPPRGTSALLILVIAGTIFTVHRSGLARSSPTARPTVASTAPATSLDAYGQVPAFLPPTPAPSGPAARPWRDALDAFDRLDPLTAKQYLLHAATLEPSSATIQAALAGAWHTLGYDDLAAQAATRAAALGRTLPDPSRRWLEARADELAGRLDQAIAGYARLSADEPETIAHRLRLAEARIRGGQATVALTDLARLGVHALPLRLGVQVALLEAQAAEAISAFHRQRAAAEKAAVRAAEAHAPLLRGRALLEAARAAHALGETDVALPWAETALELLTAHSDLHGAARARVILGELRYAQGELDLAQRHFDDGLGLANSLGNRRSSAALLIAGAHLRHHRGDTRRAHADLERALDLSRGAGNDRMTAEALLAQASLALHEGSLARAATLADLALTLWDEAGDLRGGAQALDLIGAVRARADGFAPALDAWSQALERYRTVGDRPHEGRILGRIASIHSARGALGEARELYEAERAIRHRAGDRHGVAKVDYALALIDNRTGALTDAAFRLRAALTIFEQGDEAMSILWVRRKLGDIMAQQGQLDGARRLLDDALSASRHLQHRLAEGLALTSLGDLALFARDLATARERHAAALALHDAIGDRTNAARNHLALADVHLARGQAEEALDRIDLALTTFRANDTTAHQAMAEARRALALAVLHRFAEARTALANARAHGETHENRRAALDASLVGLHAERLLTPRPPNWRQRLTALVREVEATGFVAMAHRHPLRCPAEPVASDDRSRLAGRNPWCPDETRTS